MTATNMCSNFGGFRCSTPTHHRRCHMAFLILRNENKQTKIDQFCYTHAEAIWACSMLCSIGNYNNLAYFPGIQGSCDVKHRSRKMKSSLNVCLSLKTVLSLPRKQKVSTKMEKWYLHTVKSIAKTQ